MVLYTPMPSETIFAGLYESGGCSLQMKEVEYDGVTIIVSPENDMYKIERVISTDPNDYLNPDWQPGNFIKL